MIVTDDTTEPRFIWPADSLQLPPGAGNYTCCARNHPDNTPCDRLSVGPMLSKMIDTKVSEKERDGVCDSQPVCSVRKNASLIWFVCIFYQDSFQRER